MILGECSFVAESDVRLELTVYESLPISAFKMRRIWLEG